MDLDVMISYLPLYKDALFLTMRVGWKGVAIAVLIGLIGSAIIHFEIPIAGYIVSAYTQLFRNTPLLVQLFSFTSHYRKSEYASLLKSAVHGD